MHDLNTINRLNEQAFGDTSTHLRRQGLFVVAVSEGARVVSISSHANRFIADAHAASVAEPNTGRSVRVLEPITGTAAVRDQSEDTGASFASADDYLAFVASKQTQLTAYEAARNR